MLREAADQGHMMAQAYLGDMYTFGFGVEKEDRLAFKYEEKAAQKERERQVKEAEKETGQPIFVHLDKAIALDDVRADDALPSLPAAVERATGVPAHAMSLSYAGKKLKPGKTLASHGVDAGAITGSFTLSLPNSAGAIVATSDPIRPSATAAA